MPEKRPRGLKSSQSNSKKPKPSEEEQLTEATLALPAADSDSGIEEPSDFADLRIMYHNAIEKSLEEDENESMLYTAILHECDRMLRVNDEKETKEVFPCEFHYIYGMALKNLAMCDENTQDSEQFYRAALDRLQIALESEWSEMFKVHEATAMIQIQLNSVDEAVKRYELVQDVAAQINIISAIQRFADLNEETNQMQAWNDWAKKEFQSIREKYPENIDAVVGQGTCHLSLANHFLDLAELSDDSSTVNKAESSLLQALEMFQEAEKLSKETPDNVLLCLIGETYLNLANINDPDDENQESETAQNYYKKAFEYFQKVQKNDINALPEQFLEFVTDWEQDCE